MPDESGESGNKNSVKVISRTLNLNFIVQITHSFYLLFDVYVQRMGHERLRHLNTTHLLNELSKVLSAREKKCI